MKKRYNVGDRVIITDETHGHGLDIGQIVEIVKVFSGSFHVSALGDFTTWGVTDEEIEFFVPDSGTNKSYARILLDETY